VASLDGLHQLGVIALGLVAVILSEIRESSVERLAVAAIPGDAHVPGARAARDNWAPTETPKLNGVPVMSATGIDAFMFFAASRIGSAVDRGVAEHRIA
jgi:hypothetical protein